MTGVRAIWAGLFLLGTLATGCSYDFTVLCGNSVVDDGEECDGPGATTCSALGYSSADAVLCSSSCTWDVSGCEASPCGNGAINPGESCDGTVLGPANCVTEGWTAGILACDNTCAFDTSLCTDDCGPPSVVSCPATSISDDFEDGVLAAIWGASYADGDTTYGEDQGFLMLSLPVNQAGYAAYLTHEAYSLSTYGVSVQLAVFPHTVAADCSLEVKDESTEDVAGISLSGLDLSLFSVVNQTRHVEVTVYFQGNLHRYWRLGAAGDTFFAEVSGDGTDWAPLGSMPAPFQMEHVQIALRAGSSEAIGEPGHLAFFDNFNILP